MHPNPHHESKPPPTRTSESLSRAADVLARAQSVLVITGAGISAESGLPTYRGPGGLYEKDPEMPQAISAEGLACNPVAVWKYIDQFRVRAAAVEPNAAHRVLARWERDGRFARFLIATQNIDGLHQAAGSDRVSELHGSLWRMSRPRARGGMDSADPSDDAEGLDYVDEVDCVDEVHDVEDTGDVDYTNDPDFSRDVDAMLAGGDREPILRRWSLENSRDVWEDRETPFRAIPPHNDPEVRPDVVFFGEEYGNRLLWVKHFIRGGVDAVVVIGCSGGVCLLDWVLRDCRVVNPRCAIVNINAYEDPIGLAHSHMHLALPASVALAALDEALGGGGRRDAGNLKSEILDGIRTKGLAARRRRKRRGAAP
jgi:NAD-dependent SIR2 family protein deacetylase